MVIFRSTFDQLGGFKEWLGAGSIGESGEDGEFMLRCLTQGFAWHYDDDLLIYHNKWLDLASAHNQQRMYSCGGLAVYGLYMWRGVAACKAEYFNELNQVKSECKNHLKKLPQNPTQLFTLLKNITTEIWYATKGILLARWFGLVN